MTFALVAHHNELLAAIRRRIKELGITYETLEAIAGLQSGYAAKVLADPPAKRMHPFVQFMILEALGLRTHLVEDIDLTNKLRPRFSQRKINRAVHRPPSIITLTTDGQRINGRRGGYAAAAAMTKHQRSARARIAATARWQRGKRAIVPGSAE